MTPALETLLLPFSKGGLSVPKRSLFLGAEPHPDLKTWPQVTGWQPWKAEAEAWRKAGYTAVDEPEGTWPVVLVLPGKTKDETLFSFARAFDLLEDGGLLVAALSNTSGASRYEQNLAKAAGHIDSIQKNKCRVFYARKTAEWDAGTLDEWRKLGEIRTAEGSDLLTQAGIFSASHIDPGSKLLADHLPANIRGKVADLGAGWGYLSRQLLEKCSGIQKLDLYEADARALTLAKRNLPETAAEVRYLWHDVTKGIDGIYHTIVMNPPFHAGQRYDADLGISFIRMATGALRGGGQLFIVANRQLPYERELEALGLVWRKPVEDATFKLLFAEKRL